MSLNLPAQPPARRFKEFCMTRPWVAAYLVVTVTGIFVLVLGDILRWWG